ncbi:hypothetical protein [Thalassolituus maritimus]|uniref:Uncharacterized protein n=1 Tax=Thalassolituus maritimus TaxID=484498 RepID=A0ABP9ZXN3_9GAMM
MSYVKKYPLLSPLETIERHDVLPSGSVHLGGLAMGKNPEDAKIEFIKRDAFLSLLRWSVLKLKTGPKYSCHQYDFPLKVLSWFPKALAEFQRPPSDGGLHAGAMISKDQSVDGEMLAVGSTTRGYNITNWSRDADGVNADPDYYEPTSFSMSYEMLNDSGLLRLWKELGEKYDAGEL